MLFIITKTAKNNNNYYVLFVIVIVIIVLIVVFIVTQTFIMNFVDLLQPGRVIVVKLHYMRAIGDREKNKAFEPTPANYAYYYAVLLTCFTAILIYSISFPLMLLFGCLYLWTRVRNI